MIKRNAAVRQLGVLIADGNGFDDVSDAMVEAKLNRVLDEYVEIVAGIRQSRPGRTVPLTGVAALVSERSRVAKAAGHDWELAVHAYWQWR